MKCAIDFDLNLKRLSGWACNENNFEETPEVILTRVARNDEIIPFGVYREDVKLLNIHPTGYCGFRFFLDDYQIRSGDIFRVIIKFKNGEAFGKTFIAGDMRVCIPDFIKMELPRNNFSIMNHSTNDLIRDYSDLMVLKILIIRLRRFTRAKCWRGKFVGVDYEYKDEDFQLFKKLVFEARYLFFEILPVRYIWSIIDTLTDIEPSNQKFAWFAISNLLASERMGQTLHCLFKFEDLSSPITARQLPYWGGMASNQLSNDDALDVFITRAIESLKDYAEAYSYYRFLMLSMMREKEKSVWGINVAKSEFFSDAWSFYERVFLNENYLEKSDLNLKIFN